MASDEDLHAAIQEHACPLPGAFLTGWVLIAEWVDTDGKRWLSRRMADDTTPWAADGMFHAGLSDDWADGDEDDEE